MRGSMLVLVVFFSADCNATLDHAPDGQAGGPDAPGSYVDSAMDRSVHDTIVESVLEAQDEAGTLEVDGDDDGRTCTVPANACGRNTIGDTARFCPPDGGTNRVLWTCQTDGFTHAACAVPADCQEVFFSSGNNPHFCCAE